VEAACSPEDLIFAHLTAEQHNQEDKNTVHHNSLGFIKVENFLSKSISAIYLDIWKLAPKRG